MEEAIKLHAEIAELYKEKERYRVALEKIANTKDWREDTYFISVAQQALTGETK